MSLDDLAHLLAEADLLRSRKAHWAAESGAWLRGLASTWQGEYAGLGIEAMRFAFDPILEGIESVSKLPDGLWALHRIWDLSLYRSARLVDPALPGEEDFPVGPSSEALDRALRLAIRIGSPRLIKLLALRLSRIDWVPALIFADWAEERGQKFRAALLRSAIGVVEATAAAPEAVAEIGTHRLEEAASIIRTLAPGIRPPG